MRWERHLDAVYPAPPGQIKLSGELYRLRARIDLCTVLSAMAAFNGLLVASLACRRDRPKKALHPAGAQGGHGK
jgi:hypothetical protein